MSCRPHVVADFTAVSSSLNGFLMSLAMQEKFPKRLLSSLELEYPVRLCSCVRNNT